MVSYPQCEVSSDPFLAQIGTASRWMMKDHSQQQSGTSLQSVVRGVVSNRLFSVQGKDRLNAMIYSASSCNIHEV